MPSPTAPSIPPPYELDLAVHGTIPSGLSGRLVGIDRDGVCHSVQVGSGRVSYRCRRFRTDTVVDNLVAFGGAILAFGDNSPAHELSAGVAALNRVDLAGQGRALSAYPKHDPTTGELHVISRDLDGSQAHVVISAGALTRRNRPIFDTPSRIKDLAVSRDHVALVADGFVGVTARDGEARTTWFATGVTAPHAVQANDMGDAVMLVVLTPRLERWMLGPETGRIQREVLDATPRRFARRCGEVDMAQRIVWTTGDGTVGHHDLATSSHVHHSLRPHLPGDLVFVADPSCADTTDNGWLVGFVRDTSGPLTELRVIDTADITGPPIAAIRMPRPIPLELRCTWIPATPT